MTDIRCTSFYLFVLPPNFHIVIVLLVSLEPYASVKHNSVRTNTHTKLVCHLVAGLRLKDKIPKTKDKTPNRRQKWKRQCIQTEVSGYFHSTW